IESVFDEKNINEIKKEIYEQIKQIIDKGVLEEELNRAKISIKTDWNFDLETPSKISSLIGYWTLMAQPQMPYEHLSEIEKITVNEIRDFFAQYGAQNLISHAALLPKN
ncbi:MAG: hypothetical protein LBT79_05510, partial [Elusimicrobiota bacterium]|nr:hypothetical protein [Elusimicrobiota bacterium]